MALLHLIMATRLVKRPYPSSRHLFTRFASHLHSASPCCRKPQRVTAPESTPIPKGCKVKNPFLTGGRVDPYVVKEREHDVLSKLDLPGVPDGNLRVWVQSNSLHIMATEEEEGDGVQGVSGRKYVGSIPIPEGHYNTALIKAQMRNGVLKILIPKLELHEGNDVITVKVDK